MNFKVLLISASLMWLAPSAYSAIPKKASMEKNQERKTKPVKKAALKAQKKYVDNEIVMALRLPMEKRIMALGRQPNSFESLKEMSFDKTQSLQIRWRALTALAKIDFQRSRPVLEKALKDQDWFMRNAALVTLPTGDRSMALHWSTELLQDAALVVRTAAAENLRTLRDRRSRESLIKAFDAPHNFKGKQSLWVRHYIARALTEMAVPGEESFLVRLLNDQDKRVHPWAILGLERLTGKTLGSTRSPAENRDLWISWWKNNRTNS